MKLMRIESRAMSHFGYDEENGILAIVFPDGRLYEYRAVPPEVWQGLQYADSKGDYYNQHIKYNYDFIEKDEKVA